MTSPCQYNYKAESGSLPYPTIKSMGQIGQTIYITTNDNKHIAIDFKKHTWSVVELGRP